MPLNDDDDEDDYDCHNCPSVQSAGPVFFSCETVKLRECSLQKGTGYLVDKGTEEFGGVGKEEI